MRQSLRKIPETVPRVFPGILRKYVRRDPDDCDREKPDVLYMLWKSDIRHVFRNVKTFVHCVFDPQRPYGDSFSVISEWLKIAYHTNYPVVPHIVSLPEKNENLRAFQWTPWSLVGMALWSVWRVLCCVDVCSSSGVLSFPLLRGNVLC